MVDEKKAPAAPAPKGVPSEGKAKAPASKDVPSEEGKEKPKEEKKKKVFEGKKVHKNKPTSQKWKKYTIEGDKVTRSKTCTRCGPGVFLMQAKDRVYCGKCHYTEFVSKSAEPKASEGKEKPAAPEGVPSEGKDKKE